MYRHLPYAPHRQDGTVPAAHLIAAWTGKSSRAAHIVATPRATPFCWRQRCWILAGLTPKKARDTTPISPPSASAAGRCFRGREKGTVSGRRRPPLTDIKNQFNHGDARIASGAAANPVIQLSLEKPRKWPPERETDLSRGFPSHALNRAKTAVSRGPGAGISAAGPIVRRRRCVGRMARRCPEVRSGK